MNELRRAWQNLQLRPLRSLLSTLGICFGVMAVIAMQSIGEGAKRETLAQIQALGTQNILVRSLDDDDAQSLGRRLGAEDGLSEADIEMLESSLPMLGAIAAVAEVPVPVNLADPSLQAEVLAVNPSVQTARGLGVTEGRFLHPVDLERRSLVAVIGADLARELSVGDFISLSDSDFEVVGVLSRQQQSVMGRRSSDRTVFIPLGAQSALFLGNNASDEGLSELVIPVPEEASVEAFAPVIEALLSDAHGDSADFQVIVPKELLRQAQRTQRTFNLVLGGIAALSLLVGGIGIMNIMLASVSERTREIGIRRAIGATQSHILQQFLVETCLLALLGGVFGVAGGAIIALVVSSYADWPTVVTLSSVSSSLLMAVGVGLCSGLYPAYTASRLHPVEALRHQ